MTARLLVTALFVFLGGLAFLGQRGLHALQPQPVSALSGRDPGAAWGDAQAALLQEAERRGLHRQDPLVRDRLVRNMRFADPTSSASDDRLFATALELDMHRSDAIARARLCQRAADLLLAEAPPEAPSRARLHAYLQAHPERFERAASVTFRQVLFAAEADVGSPRQRAMAWLEQHAQRGPEAARGQGDPTLLPGRMVGTVDQVARRFGDGFAAQLSEAPEGRWQGPLESPFGAHVVWVESRRGASQPELDEVAEAVWFEQRHDSLQRRRHELVDGLREHHASLTEAD